MTTLSAPASTETTQSRPKRTIGLYLAGLAATTTGLVITLVDQVGVGALDRHLHALYDPYSAYNGPGLMYGYLYVVGVLGILGWALALRLTARRSPRARLWSIVVLVLAAFALSPLFAREYGQSILPLWLSGVPALAWLFGLAGVVVLPRRGQ